MFVGSDKGKQEFTPKLTQLTQLTVVFSYFCVISLSVCLLFVYLYIYHLLSIYIFMYHLSIYITLYIYHYLDLSSTYFYIIICYLSSTYLYIDYIDYIYPYYI